MFRIFSKRMLPLQIGIIILMSFTGCESEDMSIPDSPLFSNSPYASSLTKKLVDKVNLIKRGVAVYFSEIVGALFFNSKLVCWY